MKKDNYFLYDFIRVTAALPGLAVYRYKRIYQDDIAKKKLKGGALVVSNHVGFADPIHLIFGFWYRRSHFVVMKEFFQTKWAWWFRQFKCIPVDRSSADISCFREVKQRLDDGKMVCIFPEGHIEKNHEQGTQTFKSGMVLMAMRSNCPIIPVYLVKRTKWYQRQKMVIGQPINVKEMLGQFPSLSAIDNVAQLVFQREEQLKEFYENSQRRRKK